MDLTATERDLLTELKTLLEPFEYVTNLLQANTVSISKLDFYWIILFINETVSVRTKEQSVENTSSSSIEKPKFTYSRKEKTSNTSNKFTNAFLHYIII